MPLYEYECQRCGHTFEIKQGIHDCPITRCPDCEGKLKRLIHSSHVIYKGPGFFATDNKKDTRVRSDSGKLGRRVSDIDSSNIDEISRLPP
jgi:putative FmdB family regulatory protein